MGFAANSCDSPENMRARIGANRRPKRYKSGVQRNASERSRLLGRESIAAILSVLSPPAQDLKPCHNRQQAYSWNRHSSV